MNFRAKAMKVDEWGQFQELFAEFFAASGHDRGLALFLHRNPGEESSTVLIPCENAELVEALAPGSWHDAGDVAGLGWSLLVGNASANADFGLRQPAPGEGMPD